MKPTLRINCSQKQSWISRKSQIRLKNGKDKLIRLWINIYMDTNQLKKTMRHAFRIAGTFPNVN